LFWYRTLNDLLELHSISVYAPKKEFYKDDKAVETHICHKSGNDNFFSSDFVVRLEQAWNVLVNKSGCDPDLRTGPGVLHTPSELASQDTAFAFTQNNMKLLTRTIINWLKQKPFVYFVMDRANLLDYLICKVKDCCSLGCADEDEGHAVDSHGKKRAGAECFNRREAGLTDADYKVKLNIKTLRSHLQSDWLEKQSRILEKEFGPALTVTLEDLFEFEFSDGSWALEKSFDAWSKALSALNVPPRREIILEYLKGIPKRKRHSHREELFNFDEVQAELEDSRFEWMLQASSNSSKGLT